MESQEHPGKLHFEMSIQDRIPSVIRLERETHSPLPHTPTVMQLMKMKLKKYVIHTNEMDQPLDYFIYICNNPF